MQLYKKDWGRRNREIEELHAKIMGEGLTKKVRIRGGGSYRNCQAVIKRNKRIPCEK